MMINERAGIDEGYRKTSTLPDSNRHPNHGDGRFFFTISALLQIDGFQQARSGAIRAIQTEGCRHKQLCLPPFMYSQLLRRARSRNPTSGAPLMWRNWMASTCIFYMAQGIFISLFLIRRRRMKRHIADGATARHISRRLIKWCQMLLSGMPSRSAACAGIRRAE